MPARSATAEWRGDLGGGLGTVSTESGAIDMAYSFPSRFENGEGTNPEELLGAAHAGCYSMALSAGLGRAGFTPTSVRTEARVHLEKVEGGFGVILIELDCDAEVPGIGEDAFQEHALAAKAGCPISKALASVEVRLAARLT